jgi:hypothetical protein
MSNPGGRRARLAAGQCTQLYWVERLTNVRTQTEAEDIFHGRVIAAPLVRQQVSCIASYR